MPWTQQDAMPMFRGHCLCVQSFPIGARTPRMLAWLPRCSCRQNWTRTCTGTWSWQTCQRELPGRRSSSQQAMRPGQTLAVPGAGPEKLSMRAHHVAAVQMPRLRMAAAKPLPPASQWLASTESAANATRRKLAQGRSLSKAVGGAQAAALERMGLSPACSGLASKIILSSLIGPPVSAQMLGVGVHTHWTLEGTACASDGGMAAGA